MAPSCCQLNQMLFWHLGACKRAPEDAELQAASWLQQLVSTHEQLAACRRLGCNCFSIPLGKTTKKINKNKRRHLNRYCLSLLFSVHFMQFQTQPTLTRIH